MSEQENTISLPAVMRKQCEIDTRLKKVEDALRSIGEVEGAVPEGEREHLKSRIRALEHLVDQYRRGEVLPEGYEAIEADREEGIKAWITHGGKRLFIREVTQGDRVLYDADVGEALGLKKGESGFYSIMPPALHGDSEEEA